MKATADKRYLPKSLHTVRILANVAREYHGRMALGRGFAVTPLQAVLHAAALCGYPVCAPDDALILAAVAQVSR